eukprot:UN00865
MKILFKPTPNVMIDIGAAFPMKNTVFSMFLFFYSSSWFAYTMDRSKYFLFF